MNVGQIMTHEPVTATTEMTVAEAAGLMLENHISGLPVVDADGAVTGMVTEGDLLRRAETGTERRRARWLELLMGPGRLARDYVGAHARKVGEVMTQEVVSASPQDSVESVVSSMEKHRIKRLPVVSNRRLVGIVSRADLVRALVHRLQTAESETAQDDSGIRDRILAIIDKEPWGPRFSVDVAVTNGVVELSGTITDDRERTALIVAAENTAGVKQVHDHLVWVEPTSGLVISS
jgi:CBS domain-containing protein